MRHASEIGSLCIQKVTSRCSRCTGRRERRRPPGRRTLYCGRGDDPIHATRTAGLTDSSQASALTDGYSSTATYVKVSVPVGLHYSTEMRPIKRKIEGMVIKAYSGRRTHELPVLAEQSAPCTRLVEGKTLRLVGASLLPERRRSPRRRCTVRHEVHLHRR